ncbi:MAG: hypothetical protein KA371_02065 [Acidobacteria bacterium]|nr:hypothetical protein [Acidobacteriota bacterium]
MLSREWPVRLACPSNSPSGWSSARGVLVDGALAATYRFRDAPRPDSRAFIGHLAPRHQLNRVIIVPGGELSAY